MSNSSRQYMFALIFLAVAVYQAVSKDYLEVVLYTLAGAAFVVNALSLEPRLAAHKKKLVILAWVLIGSAGVFFLYLLQFKF